MAPITRISAMHEDIYRCRLTVRSICCYYTLPRPAQRGTQASKRGYKIRPRFGCVDLARPPSGDFPQVKQRVGQKLCDKLAVRFCGRRDKNRACRPSWHVQYYSKQQQTGIIFGLPSDKLILANGAALIRSSTAWASACQTRR